MMINLLCVLGSINLDGAPFAAMLAVLQQPQGPTLLGFDVVLVGTILAGVAAGTFFYVVFCDLLPEAFHGEGPRWAQVGVLAA